MHSVGGGRRLPLLGSLQNPQRVIRESPIGANNRAAEGRPSILHARIYLEDNMAVGHVGYHPTNCYAEGLIHDIFKAFEQNETHRRRRPLHNVITSKGKFSYLLRNLNPNHYSLYYVDRTTLTEKC